MKFRYDEIEKELVISEANRIEYHQMDLWLTRNPKGYKYSPAFKMGVWNGKKSFFRDGKINLGLWREALKACQEIGVPFVVENKKDFPINREITLEKVQKFCDDFFKEHKIKTNEGFIDFKPYDHQIESAFKILKNRFCMAEVATSGGKSLIISIVIFYTLKHMKKDAKFLIIVPSITLVTQFYDNIFEYNIGVNNIMDGKDKTEKSCDIRVEEVMSEKPRKHTGTKNANVYIGTYQSLEKWPKEFFQQFHTVITDEAHGAKASTVSSILGRTFKYAYSRFGVSGTFPLDESCEILAIQSVLGPKITEVTASELKDKGIITPVEIKVIVMNHENEEFGSKLRDIRKAGMGKEAFEIEKDFIHLSEKRIEFIKKIVNKCDSNTLVLFHTIDYGQRILEALKRDSNDREYFYIDGSVSGKKREIIKKEMEKTKKNVEYTILNFGDYEIEVKSTHDILLSSGKYKSAKDITKEDDINDEFIKKLKNLKK